ncbi:hypothetical protein K505DRAFT_361342 [Melanomma pulvis-pyrius CBS 109.77]|uniref:Uncharacterized protein n=1 Tax=Melanomma pulvis-pyrius CBS 109.77 TaxID=1314802 RepID=A0A6A6XC75_9PLEO|nr:hypothetical protein K505DRAFT_361342 [Melanomma pulvis-pyrius CBS 109.77]
MSNDNMKKIDTITTTMANVEIDSEGPNAMMSRLAEQMLDTDLQEPTYVYQGEEVYIPPGTSLEDELLILSGVDPSHWDTYAPSEDAELQAPNQAKEQDKQGAVRRKYECYLDFSDEDLADAPLPDDLDELNELGSMISDALWNNSPLTNGKVLFSPRAHPNYPCWLPEHRVNKVIRDAYTAAKTK